MRSYRFLWVFVLSCLFLFAEEEPTGSLIIEYGGHDMLESEKAFTKQQYVNPEYYENVIEHVQGGNQLAKRGQYNDAVARFKMALKSDSTYVFAHNGLANAYLQLHHPDSAEYHFRKSIKFGPTYAFTYNNLANLLLIKGSEEEAFDLLQTALKYDPNSAYINYNLGNIYFNREKYDIARVYYTKALKLNEDLDDARYNLAITYKNMKYDALMVETYEELVNRRPGHLKGVLNLAAHYIQSQRVEKALLLYKQAVIINPDVELYLALGHAYHNEGYYLKEIDAYRSAVAADSTDLDALYYLAIAYYEQDMIISSKDVINKALKIDPNDEMINIVLELIELEE